MRASDELFFGINVAGYGRVLQRGREITFGDGDAFLLNVAAGVFAISRPVCGQFVGLRVPGGAIAPLVRDLADDTLRPIPGTTDSVKLLASYLHSLLGGRVLAAHEAARLLVTHVHDLIALSLGATVPSLTLFGHVAKKLHETEGIDTYSSIATVADEVLALAAASQGYPPCAYTLRRI